MLQEIEDDDPIVPCSFGAWRAALNQEDSAVFDRWFADIEGVSADRLAKRVGKAGHQVSGTNVRNHRRGECVWCAERFA